MRYRLILPFFLLLEGTVFSAPRMGLINSPVADLRSSSGTLPQSLDYDPLEESQLLYNEPVKILEESGDWLRVEAPEQREFTHTGAWQGYPGGVVKSSVTLVSKIVPPNLVVKKKTGTLRPEPLDSWEIPGLALSIGTKLNAWDAKEKNGFWKIKTAEGKAAWIKKDEVRLLITPPEEFARRIILDSGEAFLGDLYFWGGRSAPAEETPGVRAVDCSGLVNLSYRVAGMDIPRDSREQYMAARKIKKEDLKPGDLIFSASKDDPEKVTHVALSVDSMTVLEAPSTGLAVRKTDFDKKYGPDPVVYFGTFFGKD